MERDGFAWDSGPVAADDAVGVRGAVRRHGRAAAPTSSSCCGWSRSPATASPTAARSRSAPTCRGRWRRSRPGRPARARTGCASSGVCAGMWRASVPVLTGPPPWPPVTRATGPEQRLRIGPRRGEPRPSPADLAAREAVVDAAAAGAGVDARSAPATGHRALRHLRGRRPAPGAGGARGRRLRRARLRRLAPARRALRAGRGARRAPGDARRRAAAAARRCGGSSRRAAGGSPGVETEAGLAACDAVVADVDEATSAAGCSGARRRAAASGERSLSGLVADARAARAHARPRPPRDPLPAPTTTPSSTTSSSHRRPVRDPTVYVSASCATDAGEAPAGDRELVRAGQRAGGRRRGRLGRRRGGADRPARRRRADRRRARAAPPATSSARPARWAARSTAPRRTGGSGRCGAPGNTVRGARGLWLVGGTAHPGGGLPIVALGGALVARAIGPA